MTTTAALTAAESGTAWLNRRTMAGFGVLATAVGLGTLGDGLLRATPWGVNAALWVTALATTLTCLLRWQRLDAAAGGRWMLALAAVFA